VVSALGRAWRWHFTTPAGWFTLFTVLLMLVANGVFGKLLRAPTVAGQAAMDHIRGFKMYLEVAEAEDLKRVKAPPPPLTPQLFESYLPAALALGVEQRWAERFADVLNVQAPNYSPAWYAGPGWNIRDMGSFSSNLGSSLSSAIPHLPRLPVRARVAVVAAPRAGVEAAEGRLVAVAQRSRVLYKTRGSWRNPF
jgi:hypothetical protein